MTAYLPAVGPFGISLSPPRSRSPRRRRVRWLAAAFLCVAALTAPLQLGVQTGALSWHTRGDLQAAYTSLLSNGLTRGESPAQEASVIAAAQPGWIVSASGSEARAYLKLRDHQRGHTVIAEPAPPGHVTLLGRGLTGVGLGGTIERLQGDDKGHYSFTTLYTGKVDWRLTPKLLLGELAAFIALGLALGLGDRLSRRRQSRNERLAEQERLATWRELVPSGELYGPAEPRDGFEIYRAELEEREGEQKATFRAVPMRWQRNYWWPTSRTSTQPPAATPAPVSIDRGEDIADVSARWFEFCNQVAAANAARWETERERLATLDAQAAAVEEGRRQALESGKLSDLLTPGPELVRNLVPSGAHAPRR